MGAGTNWQDIPALQLQWPFIFSRGLQGSCRVRNLSQIPAGRHEGLGLFIKLHVFGLIQNESFCRRQIEVFFIAKFFYVIW